jgi:acyl-CoA reductase-like NAD-dependent aldehyde dehydrogenase
LFKVANESETIALANDTPFGLAGTIFSGDSAQSLSLNVLPDLKDGDFHSWRATFRPGK